MLDEEDIATKEKAGDYEEWYDFCLLVILTYGASPLIVVRSWYDFFLIIGLADHYGGSSSCGIWTFDCG